MPYTDLPLDQLRAYRPALVEPDDLDAFWADTLADARTHPLDATFERVDSGLAVIDTWDVTFRGFGGSPIRGWLHLPAGRADARPAVVEYIGYGGGRGLPHEKVIWAAAGYAHLVMDTRGQGSTWSVGDTPDPEADGSPAHPGFMTRGILDPSTYYYRRVFTDAVRAVETARSHPADRPGPDRASPAGARAAASRSRSRRSCRTWRPPCPTSPSLCDFARAIAITDRDPYPEIVRYLKAHRDHTERVLRTLRYVDVAALGRRATAPALVLGRADGRGLSAVHRLRRVQRVRRSEGDHRVPVQRPRGRRRLPRRRQDALAGRPVRGSRPARAAEACRVMTWLPFDPALQAGLNGRRHELFRLAAPVFRAHGYRGSTIKALAHACHLSPAASTTTSRPRRRSRPSCSTTIASTGIRRGSTPTSIHSSSSG